jgi:hypothetical protein
VITTVDDRLRQEARRFALRYTCEFCAWFDAEWHVCSHAFPTEPHRQADLERAQTITFCKEFELA